MSKKHTPSFPRSCVGMQTETNPSQGMGSHAGAWEPDNKKKALVPELRFPEFIGADEWKEKPLNKISEIVMGSSPKSSAYNESGIGLPLLQGNADIKNRLSTPRIFTSQITKECGIGDILLSVRAPVGTVAKSNHNACIGRGLSAIRAFSDNCQEFIYQWLLYFEPLWSDISQGGTFDAVNSDDIRNLLAPVPEKDEQQKIADCLSSIDDLITAHSQKHDALIAHKKGLMQQLFPSEGETVPKLRFPEFRDAGVGEWNVKTLEQLTIRIGDGIHTTPKYNDNGNYHFINGNNLVEGKISISKSTKKVDKNEAKKHSRDLSNRTILLSINGTIGNLALYDNEKIMLGKSAAYINLKDNINIGFIYNTLKTSKIHNFFFSELTGSTIKNLSLKTIRETKISIPTPLEQQKIANCLSSIDELITVQAKKIESLKAHKKGLMQQLFPTSDEVNG